MKFALLLFLTSYLSCFSYGQENDVPHFVKTDSPIYQSKKWHHLNFSRAEFEVNIQNGKLKAHKHHDKPKTEFKINTGLLIGLDYGEFGGELAFVPINKIKKTFGIKSGNVKFIFSVRDTIYFIEGLAHLFTHIGSLYRLDTIGDKFTYTKILDFEDAPEAFAIYNNKILMVTSSGFYVIQDKGNQILFSNTFWNGLYPNSIAVADEKNVYIGMRGGIVKLDLTTKEIKFYRPKFFYGLITSII
jgi:hypothetical protein